MPDRRGADAQGGATCDVQPPQLWRSPGALGSSRLGPGGRRPDWRGADRAVGALVRSVLEGMRDAQRGLQTHDAVSATLLSGVAAQEAAARRPPRHGRQGRARRGGGSPSWPTGRWTSPVLGLHLDGEPSHRVSGDRPIRPGLPPAGQASQRAPLMPSSRRRVVAAFACAGVVLTGCCTARGGSFLPVWILAAMTPGACRRTVCTWLRRGRYSPWRG